METEENTKKQQQSTTSPKAASPDSSPPRRSGGGGAAGHISISPELSPASSHNSPGHISLSSPVLGNSPPRSSSDHISIHPSPPPRTHPPTVSRGPEENERVVVQEPKPTVTRAVLNEPPKATKSDPGAAAARSRPPAASSREKTVKRAALGFRVFGLLFCLVSFAVMAADRDRGWAVDSFDRYKEFRYCMSVNVIGFVYSVAQAFDLLYNLATGKYIVDRQQRFRYYLDFAADQMIAYLLISASSSATIRVDDWQMNWGKDKFPDMATASISMSFLAFVALAASSLISGYALCTSKSL